MRVGQAIPRVAVACAALTVVLSACSTNEGAPSGGAAPHSDSSMSASGSGQSSSSGGTSGTGGSDNQGRASASLGVGGSGAEVGGAAQGTGGALAEGGTSETDGGGGTGDGGASGNGGAVTEAGGASSNGGTSSNGGAKGAGGAKGSGGASGGGAKGSGGASASGGAKGAGGAAIGNGGVSGSGGATGNATGGSVGAGGATGSGGATGTSCLSAPLLGALGTDRVLVGASMSDATAASAPFTLRYEYLSGGMADGSGPCARCDVGCTSAGKSCANTLPDGGPGGCGWWGCWQWDQDPPGAYARGFFSTDKSHGQIPMITWYEVLQSSGAKEGAPEVTATANAAFMGRYLANYKFLLDQIGQSVVFVHLEPDFWGYAEQMNADPHATPAAVASASSECTGFENSIAGLGRCMIDMARRHAPNAKVGLHGSGWGTNIDVLLNTSKTLNVPGEANKLGAFLAECGPDADFVAVDASDRDADWYETQGRNTWWDATNATLPNFHQAFTWASALAVKTGKPVVWWQLPVGNVNLPDTTNAWRDNRVDYFFDHMDEVATAHGVAIAFGAGDGAQTTPETDGGHLVTRVKAYATAGGQVGCP